MGISPMKRFLSILTEYVYWDAFHEAVFIDRKIFNKVMQSLNLSGEEKQEAIETLMYGKCYG